MSKIGSKPFHLHPGRGSGSTWAIEIGSLGSIMQFENLLSEYQVPHEWHMYSGDHSETYWSAHVMEYLQWYAEGWKSSP